MDFFSFHWLCCSCCVDGDAFCVDECGASFSLMMAECVWTLMLLYLVLLGTAHAAHSIYPRIRLSHKGKKHQNKNCIVFQCECSIVLHHYESKDTPQEMQHMVLNCLKYCIVVQPQLKIITFSVESLYCRLSITKQNSSHIDWALFLMQQ